MISEIKLAAAARKIAKIEVKERKLMLTYRGDYILLAGRFPRLRAEEPAGRLKETLSLLRAL